MATARATNLLMEGEWSVGGHPSDHYVRACVTVGEVWIWMSWDTRIGWSKPMAPWDLWEWQGVDTLRWRNRDTNAVGNTWHRAH